jgi:hypothetical protein
LLQWVALLILVRHPVAIVVLSVTNLGVREDLVLAGVKDPAWLAGVCARATNSHIQCSVGAVVAGLDQWCSEGVLVQVPIAIVVHVVTHLRHRHGRCAINPVAHLAGLEPIVADGVAVLCQRCPVGCLICDAVTIVVDVVAGFRINRRSVATVPGTRRAIFGSGSTRRGTSTGNTFVGGALTVVVDVVADFRLWRDDRRITDNGIRVVA